jgi:hypothetical protein
MDSTKSVLFLSRDGTFQQQVYRAGKVEHTQGTWRRVGEGGVVFSKNFLKISGKEAGQADEVYGHVEKKFGLFFSINLTEEQSGPVFQKQLIY